MKYIFAMVFCLSLNNCFAAAWTQGESQAQLIIPYIYYQSDQAFDNNSNIINAGNYLQNSLSPYFEYGFTNDLTIGFNGSFNYVLEGKGVNVERFQGNLVNNSIQQYYYSNLNLFLRQKILEKNGFVLSWQPNIKIPDLLYNNEGFSLIDNTSSYELRALAGYGFKLNSLNENLPYSGQYHFFNTEFAYRKNEKYLASVDDELLLDFTFGFRPYPKWLLLTEGFSTFRKNYSVDQEGKALVKGQLSLVKNFNNNVSIQIGVFDDLWGKNIGKGRGAIISYWYRF